MPTARKTNAKRRKAKTRKGEETVPVGSAEAGGPYRIRRTVEPADLDPAKIDFSPFRPRLGFPEEEINALGNSMVVNGQLCPVLVRPSPTKKGRYELIDGERRVRGVRRVGIRTVRAEVGAFTDAEARTIIVVSALQRKDLDPIEEARAFKAALDAGDAPGPTELARHLGLSQGHVSNRLRLLDLPADVQAKVISQEIPATHARELARLKGHPDLASAIAQDLANDAKDQAMPTVEQFRHDLAYDVERHARRLDGEEYDQKSGRRVPLFTPTPEQRDELRIVSVEKPNYGGKPETVEFTTNQAAWKKMQTAHRKQWLKDNPPGKSGNGKPAKKAAKKKLTPAQEKARAEEQARVYGRRLYAWRCDWLRWLCYQWITDGRLSDVAEDLVWVLLYFAASQRTWNNLTDVEGRDGALVEILKGQGVKVQGSGYGGHDLAGALPAIDPASFEIVVRPWLAAMFWTGQPTRTVPDADVAKIAAFLRVGVEAAWLEDQAGPLSESYWNLHTREQLVELGAELKVAEIKPSMPKPAMVKAFLAHRPKPDDIDVGLNLPKELKKAKRPK